MQNQVDIVLGNYKYTQKYCIGQGSFGKVYKGINLLTNRQVAIKQMDSKQITTQQITSQITILKQLKHPNIVQYQDAFQNNGFFYIVTQYCKNGDLRNVFQDSDIQQQDDQKQQKILKMLKQVFQGFQYLRQHNIIHRDMKPSNILLHQGNYKIADFGLAKNQSIHRSVVHQELIGVPIYMSPQILSKNYYTFKCDVWSMGIVIYEMWFEALPWKSQDVDSLFFQIMRNPHPYLDRKTKLPKMIMFLLKNTLQYLEKDRLSWQQLLQAIKNIKNITQSGDLIGKQLLNPPSKLIHNNYSLPLSQQLHKSLPLHQIQILNHLFSQAKSIQSQLLSLCPQSTYKILLDRIIKYLSLGFSTKQLLTDCIYMFLKSCINNLHVFMIDLENLEDGRQVLIFLELSHDFLYAAEHTNPQQFRKRISESNRKQIIDIYTAQVISKISTYVMKREFQTNAN